MQRIAEDVLNDDDLLQLCDAGLAGLIWTGANSNSEQQVSTTPTTSSESVHSSFSLRPSETTSCWGHELGRGGEPEGCFRAHFDATIGPHLKDRFCPKCRTDGVLVPTTKVRAVPMEQHENFPNSSCVGLWNRNHSSGLPPFRLINHTPTCEHAKLLVFESDVPLQLSTTLTDVPINCLQAGGQHARLWPSKATLVPHRPRRTFVNKVALPQPSPQCTTSSQLSTGTSQADTRHTVYQCDNSSSGIASDCGSKRLRQNAPVHIAAGPNSQLDACSTSGSSQASIPQLSADTEVNELTVRGDLHVHGDTIKYGGSSSWTVVSDARFKDAISPFTPGSAELVQLRPRVYQYNGLGPTEADGKYYVGLVSHHMISIY